MEAKYQPLVQDNTTDEEARWTTTKQQPSRRFFHILSSVLQIIVYLSIGVVIGLSFNLRSIQESIQNHSSSPLEPLGPVREAFTYNRTFSEVPSPETDRAWESIFPIGRGFIFDPANTTQVALPAVFHELHCLDGLRHALYSNNQQHHGHQTTEGGHKRDIPAEERHHGSHQGSHNDFAHIRHCIDYLRQSLMCHADANLEPLDQTLGGVNGWHNERQCRDYNHLVRWTEARRTHDRTDIS